MTPLRRQMITAMQMHGFSPRTHESYLAAVRDLAKFTRRSPDILQHADLTRYFEHLVLQRTLAPASVRLMYNGIRFFYLKVLGWPTVDPEVTLPKRPQRIPALLTRGAVAAILAACDAPRDRTILIDRMKHSSTRSADRARALSIIQGRHPCSSSNSPSN